MSATTPAATNHADAADVSAPSPGGGIFAALPGAALVRAGMRFWASTIGKKWIVGLSGGYIALWLLGHLIGNLLIFVGSDAINGYAELLHHALHGAALWIHRAIFAAAITVHVVGTVQLKLRNRAARGPEKYAVEATREASLASKWMIASGVVILAFFLIHIQHLTLRWTNDYDSAAFLETTEHGERMDVYKMMVTAFSHWWVCAFYILGVGALCWHLSHGVSSVLQTLGVAREGTWPLIRLAGWAYAGILFCGNAVIPLAVLVGWVH